MYSSLLFTENERKSETGNAVFRTKDGLEAPGIISHSSYKRKKTSNH